MSNGLSLYHRCAGNAVNIIRLPLALLWWMRKRSHEEARTTDTTGHTWDGDLREYNNPLPRWWLWTFLLSGRIFSVDLSRHVSRFRQQRRHAGMVVRRTSSTKCSASRKHKRTDDPGAVQRTRAPAELSQNPDALKIARNVFANNCSTCHGSDARGASGYPNLTDGDWLWGGAPERIEETISAGRTGAMPGWGPVLGTQGVEDMIAYVMQLSGRSAAAGDATAAAPQFATLCSACHGADGRGNQQLGGPNLADNIWLYGSSPSVLRATIANGRTNQMPAHADRLGAQRIKLLAGYVLSLSQANGTSSGAAAGQ